MDYMRWPVTMKDCDRNLCDVVIKKSDGYLVYNPITDLTTKNAVGAMLICDSCGDKIFSSKAVDVVDGPWSNNIWKMTEENFTRYIRGKMKGFHIQRKSAGILTMTDLDKLEPEMFTEFYWHVDEIATLGIVQTMRRKKQKMKKAKKEAKKLAKIWWKDSVKAEIEVSRTIFTSSTKGRWK